MQVGDLVKWKGSIGLVMGVCKKRWAAVDDVWVLWADKPKPKIEAGRFLEVLNESR